MSSNNQEDAPAVSGFLAKTFDIFSDVENFDLCSWGPTGDTIVVKKIDDFSKIILPKHFKHSNFQSFVRQLNMYDFHKTVADPSNGEFQHVFFLQNRRDLLPLIKRKAHNHRGTSNESAPTATGIKKNAAAANSVIDNGLMSVPSFLPIVGGEVDYAPPIEHVEHKIPRSDLDKRLREVEKYHARMYDLETNQARIMRENASLNQQNLELQETNLFLHDKCNKILKLMFALYTNTPLTRVSSISNDQQRSIGVSESHFIDLCHALEIDTSFLRRTSSIEDYPPTTASNVGNPVSRGNSFDIAASSVLAPYNADFMSFPSFSGGYPQLTGTPGSSGLGPSLARLNSLDPYAYPPVYGAGLSSTGSTVSNNDNLIQTLMNNISAAQSIPLLENTPSKSDADSVLGQPLVGIAVKRELENKDTNGSNKKVKLDYGGDNTNTPSNNKIEDLQRLDSLEYSLQSIIGDTIIS